jgi:hypothetical protein
MISQPERSSNKFMNIQQATRLETAQSSSYVFMNMEIITDVQMKYKNGVLLLSQF